MKKIILILLSIFQIYNLNAQPSLRDTIIFINHQTIDDFSLQIETGVIDQIDADLFVSPNGDNSNSGLNEDSPLKTINYALSIIDTDSTHPHIVHLLDGEYNEGNGNSFPISIPEYVTLIGTNKNCVILNGGFNEGDNESIFLFRDKKHVQINNLTIKGGGGMLSDDGSKRIGGGIVCLNSNPVLKDLIITKNETVGYGGGLYIESSKPILENLIIIENIGRSGGGGMEIISSHLKIINVSLIKNTSVNLGGGVNFYSSSSVFINSLISENRVIESGSYFGGGGVCSAVSNLTFINSTIAGNKIIDSAGLGGAIFLSDSKIKITNSIIWNNLPNEIYCSHVYGSTLNMQYNDLNGGKASINAFDSDTINWLEGNIEYDPIFLNSGDNPYQLNTLSPCIDAGNPDTIGLKLPEYDLIGNARVFNYRIDMGAFEWNNLGIENYFSSNNNELQVDVYPNPFSTKTFIEYYLEHPEFIRIIFFNQFGKQVNVIEKNQTKGPNKIDWSPKILPGGIYCFKLVAGKKIASGSVVLMNY